MTHLHLPLDISRGATNHRNPTDVSGESAVDNEEHYGDHDHDDGHNERDDDTDDDYVDSSPVRPRQTRSRTAGKSRNATKDPAARDEDYQETDLVVETAESKIPRARASRRKTHSSRKDKRSLNDDECAAGPMIKKSRIARPADEFDDELPSSSTHNTRSTRNNPPRQNEHTASQTDHALPPSLKQRLMVQMSVAKDVDPVEICPAKSYTLAQLDTMTKCRNAVVRDFSPEIAAAGLKGELHILCYRLERFDRVSSTTSGTDQDERWEAITRSSSPLFEDWVDRVRAANGTYGTPCIQLVLLYSGASGSCEENEPLLSRFQKPDSGETIHTQDADPGLRRSLRQRRDQVQTQAGDQSAAELKNAIAENKRLKAEIQKLKADYKTLGEEKAMTDGKYTWLEGQKKILEEDNEQLRKDGYTMTDRRQIYQMTSLLNARKAGFEALCTDQAENKKLTKATEQMALDLEYASASYNPSESLQPGEVPYWSKYLPKRG